MKKLQCEMTGGDFFLDQLKGKKVTVTKIDLHCAVGGGFKCTVVLDDDVPADVLKKLGGVVKNGVVDGVWSENLLPLDTSMVPPTHNTSRLLKNVWVFTEARNDAWFRWQPKDLKKYEEENGTPWKDVRVYDVGMRAR